MMNIVQLLPIALLYASPMLFIVLKFVRMTKYFARVLEVLLMAVTELTNAKTKESINGARHLELHAQAGAQEYVLIMKYCVTVELILVMDALLKKSVERQ